MTLFSKESSKLNLSYFLYYTEVSNEFAGPISASLPLGDTNRFEKMLQLLATLCPIWPARDLNLRPSAPEKNALPLDQVGNLWPELSFLRFAVYFFLNTDFSSISVIFRYLHSGPYLTYSPRHDSSQWQLISDEPLVNMIKVSTWCGYSSFQWLKAFCDVMLYHRSPVIFWRTLCFIRVG